MNVLLERARALESELVAVRRDLHRHPELSFAEARTAEVAAAHVAASGFDVKRGVGGTGVVAELRNGAGPTVALRADMDALPIQEATDVAYASTVPGVMHACGHDFHVAGLIGAARLLTGARESGAMPPGTVRLLFQPSEEASDAENRSGAERMVEDGAMDGVAAVFGLHVWAHLPAGRVFVHAGPLMAGSDSFTATIGGVSAHAARPHEGVDAVVLAAHAILACQHAVARRLSPLEPGVLTIGTVSGGSAENVIADRVALRGTMRFFDDDVRATLRRALHDGISVAESLGGRASVEVQPGYPPVVNDAGMSALARSAVAAALGEAVLADAEPFMGADDFSILLARAPGCYLWLGAALEPPREHHHPLFDIDERALPAGAAALAACALAALRDAPS